MSANAEAAVLKYLPAAHVVDRGKQVAPEMYSAAVQQIRDAPVAPFDVAPDAHAQMASADAVAAVLAYAGPVPHTVTVDGHWPETDDGALDA